MDYAFQWVIYNGGITTESDYPYKSGSTGSAGTCNYPKTYDYAVSLYSYQDVTTNCESCLKNAVANQPVAVAIDASGSGFQLYSGGIFTGPCGTNLDHAVLVVGFNRDSLLDREEPMGYFLGRIRLHEDPEKRR